MYVNSGIFKIKYNKFSIPIDPTTQARTILRVVVVVSFTWLPLKMVSVTWLPSRMDSFTWFPLRMVSFTWLSLRMVEFSYNASSGRYGVIVYKNRPVNEWIIIKMGSKQRALKKKFRKGSHVKLTILKGTQSSTYGTLLNQRNVQCQNMVELTNAIPTREASSPSSWHELRVRATM
jgi:hypothetical protein